MKIQNLRLRYSNVHLLVLIKDETEKQEVLNSNRLNEQVKNTQPYWIIGEQFLAGKTH